MSYEKEQAHLRRLLEEVDSDLEDVDDEESDGEENIVEFQLSDTDTEQEAESDVEDLAGPAPKPSRVPTFLGKDGTVWKKHRPPQTVRTRKSNLVTHLPGPKTYAKNAKSIDDCWSLFFSNDILNLIVQYTNQHINSVKDKFARERSARETDLVEIKAVLGLLYLAGVLKSNRLNVDELWERDGSGIELFWLTMSKQRFLFLIRHLRFDDSTTRTERKVSDKLAPIRDVFTIFADNCQKSYTISEYATIDEKLEGFRGRCAFKQYIPSKPNKYGLKVFALVDAKTKYTLTLEPYVGLQPEGLYRKNNDPASIVLRLIAPISGSGRNVTCDNWFTSFNLIATLREKHNLTYVGTVRKNKKELPLEFVNTKTRPVASSMFGFQEGTTIVSYIPKKYKNVILASSMHHDDTIDPATGEKYKPEIITFYNGTKGGVDTVDELCSTYNVARNTRRWPMVLFYSIMNMAGINGQIIYMANNPNSNLVRRKFLKQLAVKLADEHLKRRSLTKNVPVAVRERRQEVAGTSADVPKGNPETPRVKKRCHLCTKDSKTRYFCKFCKKFLCLSHAEFGCPNCLRNVEEP
ncbi:hypothetical protein Zmor_005897 [Zophobas morio]|uniref:PiggyBac transposable element-derived protein domain-containing protein n=1 Tax=Zophobas morio TaxID=2755281 RepID=A0AA38M8G0_9CUCU|nr:hypothetical protein Zmor_023977 [Zophobas morio]KAJ3661502.1 hypothetical protein Zmor_005897 [Zophobas morio]